MVREGAFSFSIRQIIICWFDETHVQKDNFNHENYFETEYEVKFKPEKNENALESEHYNHSAY